jgi:hypothetical protein
MKKKLRNNYEFQEYAHLPLGSFHRYTEWPFGNDVIKPGDKIKIKNRRGTFTFRSVAHNSNIDATWVDCFDDATHQFRAFPIDTIKTVLRPKKSRRKKLA